MTAPLTTYLLRTSSANRSILPGLIQSGGDDATLTGGYGATLTGGDGAMLGFRWWDGSRWRIAVAYVGEDGILPGVAYHCVRGKVEAA